MRALLMRHKTLWPFLIIIAITAIALLGRQAGTAKPGAAATAVSTQGVLPSALGGASTAAGKGTSSAAQEDQGSKSMAYCPLSRLPDEAKAEVALIKKGGPFAHPRNDGVTFRNSEGRLPKAGSTYYREYTVETPGSPDRGTRRIITGGDPATSPEKWYYTDDHYDSFCEIQGL